MTKKKEKRPGNCYSTAARALISDTPLRRHLIKEGLFDEAVLVHGVVSGQGPLEGRRIGHAWIEAKGLAVDWSNGKHLTLPAWVYRLLGEVGREFVTYTAEQATLQMVRTRHFGPWNPRVDPR